MKILRYIVPVISGLLLLQSCNELGKVKFNSSYSKDFSIYPDTVITETTLAQEIVACNIDSLLHANNVPKDIVESVKVKEIVVKSKNGKTLNGIKSFKTIFIPENLPEVVLADLPSLPENTTSVTLKLKNNDLKKYMILNKYTLKLNGTLMNKDTILINLSIKYEYTTSPNKGGL
jgi:hypothetical protein